MKMNVSEIKITDGYSLLKAVESAKEKFTGQVWWRGQRCENWHLNPSVYRRDVGYKYEQNIIVRFQQRAPVRHHKVPRLDEKHSWLFLMQHYRLPTRLLDWTESPLIGCYFSTETGDCIDNKVNILESSDGALYALSPYSLNEDQIGEHSLLMPEHGPCLKLVNRAFSSEVDDEGYIVAVRPSEEDIRMMVQLSVFTIHGSGLSIDDLENNENFTIKFIVPQEEKNNIRADLKRLGIRESNIFPDLEHLANEVSETIFQPAPKESYAPADFDYLNFDTWTPRDPEAST